MTDEEICKLVRSFWLRHGLREHVVMTLEHLEIIGIIISREIEKKRCKETDIYITYEKR